MIIIIGLPKLVYSQEKQAEQTWHIPDLKNAPVNVHIEMNYEEISDTIPIRGTKYKIRVPENWNGILISDLDYVKSANSKRNLYLLEQGYALSGTQRRQGRVFNYDPAHEIHDIISVLDIFENTFGKPKSIIQLGCSGGGTITLAMAEIHPDRIDGAIAGCGATSPWMANTHLDGLFVLQALIAPELPIAALPLKNPEIGEIEAKWLKAIKEAQKTPEGRARIALAITIGQWPAWGARGKAPVLQPDAKDVYALQESMYLSLLTLLPSKATFGTGMLEQAGRGQLKWNTGVDYKEFYENGNAFYKKAVKKLYKDANLNLNDELEKINAFPRIKSDANAIKYWSVPGRTHIGEPKVPQLRIHTSGDGLVYPSMAQGYEELVKEKGYDDFFRIAYVNSWGHCSFSLAEWVSAIKTMEERMNTGVWPKTDPETLNKLGKIADPEGKSRYFNYQPVTKYNRAWSPTVNDFKGSHD
ncbi:alpha/beta hydrolase family protein [Maribacter vaceletii]|nr:alpha/beta hydrolase [Maribacter vaceletii]